MTRLAILSVLITVVAFGCSTLPERTSGSRDYLLGWYDLPYRDHDTRQIIEGPGTLIPVFKIGRTYYSVCRGFEVPLKECAEGLEWAPTPSSMNGTTIGYDVASSKVYIRIVDAGLAGNDDMYISGEKQFMKKIEKPSWFPILNAKTQPPRTNDDFLGRYQLAWMPGIIMTMRKEAERYYLVIHLQSREHNDDIMELTPLPDRLGFTSRDKINLTYNQALKRFELISSRLLYSQARMPLVRVAPEALSHSDAAPIPKMDIGIPSWH